MTELRTFRTILKRARHPAILVSLGLVAACSPALPGDGAKAPTVENSTGMATCQAAKDPMNPLVVEWPATAKTALEAASQRGLVVVSYMGCTMKVLDACEAGGSYAFKQLTPNKDTIDIDSESKLYAELPLGVASLRGELERGSRLSLNYVAVGQQTADGAPMGLRGNCEGATHFVRVLTVGAYSLTASAARAASAGASAAGAGAGGSVRDKSAVLRHSGDPDLCASDPNGKDCRAILQVGLAPLPQQQAGGEKRLGFGQGLGGLAPLPTVSSMGDVNLDAGLAGTDVELLKKVQAAKRQERDTAVNSEQKRNVWQGVVEYSSNHPYRQQAQNRADQWGSVAIAEAQRAKKAAAVCDQEVRDSTKLKELEAIDDDVMPATQKKAYRREYERAYAPFKEILTDCDNWRKKSAESWVALALERAADAERRKLRAAEEEVAETRRMETETRVTEERDSAQSVRTWKTVAQVTGIVVSGAGVVLMGLGYSESRKAKEGCEGSICPSSNKTAADSAGNYGNFGLAGLGTGLLLFTTGYFWPSQEAAPARREQAGRWGLIPGPGQAGLGTQVKF